MGTKDNSDRKEYKEQPGRGKFFRTSQKIGIVVYFYKLKLPSHHENPNKNISTEESKALIHLKNNDKITIKKADKGAAVVIMNRDDYIKEGIRQLSDANFYVKLDHDPTTDNINEIHNTS